MNRGVAPSIISADYANLEGSLRAVEAYATQWHVDIMDGHYVPNLTIGPMIVEAIASVSKLPQDVHLMITNPADSWQWYAKAGAARIAFHPDTTPDPVALLHEIQDAGLGAGLAVNPDVEPSEVEKFVRDADHFVVMSVYPGFSGQTFIPAVLPKLEALRQLVGEKDLIIDGGVSPANAEACVAAGANVLVSASAIFGADAPAEVARRMRDAAEQIA